MGKRDRKTESVDEKRAKLILEFDRAGKVLAEEEEEEEEAFVISLKDITERKQSEEKLKESEERYRSIYTKTKAMLHSIDINGEFIAVSDYWLQKLGYKRREVIGKKSVDFLTKKSKRYAVNVGLPEFRRRGYANDVSYQFVKKNGEIMDTLLSAVAEYDSGGKFKLSIAVLNDITERRQADEKVRLLQSLSETINKADNVHDALMGIIKEVCEATDWAVGEAWVPSNDRTFLELGAWHSKDAKFKPFKKVAEKFTFLFGEGLPGKAWASKKSESLQYVSKDLYFLRQNAAQEIGLKTAVSIPVLADDEVVVVLTFFLIEVGKVDEDFIDLVTAVTYQLGSLIQRKSAEDNLKLSEGKFRSLFEDSKDAIYINKRDGQFIEVNQSMLNLLGYSREELMKIKADELYVNSDDRKRAQRKIDDEGNIKDFEVKWRIKDGTEIDIILTSTGRRGKDGTIVGYQGIIRDITKRKQEESKLRKSHEQMRALASRLQFAREEERTEIAHEIHDELGQALTALKLDLFSLIDNEPEDKNEFIKAVESMINLTAKTIDTVKRISTELRPGILDVMGIVAAIEWQAAEFEKKTRTKCEVNIKLRGFMLDKDLSTAIFRVFQEILTNIIRHSGASKTKVTLKQVNRELRLKVSDNGKGIPEAKILDPTSFGLLSMRERLLPWRGKITFKGTKNKGTDVTLTVPLDA